MAYHLAVELLHAIFRHLEGEKQSLFSCSLVCMSWTSIAHYHLFRTIHLTERHIPSLLLPLIPHRLAQIPFDPSWGLYVKKLELRGGDYCETTVAVVVRKLPGLRVFILKQARLLSSDLCGCLFKKCRPYKHDRPVDLLQVVAALTQLKVVQMHGVSFSEHETPEACTQHVSAPVNPDVQLESLSLKDVVLSGVRLDPFLEVFKRSPDSLKRFSFDFQRGTANSRPLHKSRSTILGGFLLAGAPSLKELIVDLRDLGLPPKCPVPPTWERLYDYFTGLFKSMNIHQCITVASLDVWMRRATGLASWAALCALLDVLPRDGPALSLGIAISPFDSSSERQPQRYEFSSTQVFGELGRLDLCLARLSRLQKVLFLERYQTPVRAHGIKTIWVTPWLTQKMQRMFRRDIPCGIKLVKCRDASFDGRIEYLWNLPNMSSKYYYNDCGRRILQ